jgi:serine/threonine-protein kinase
LKLAEQALKNSLAVQPSYEAYSNLGVLYLGQKRYSEAAAMTRKAIAIDDENYLVWENLRTAEEWLHDVPETKAVIAREVPLLEKFVKIKSQNGLAHGVLATLYAKQGENAKAELHIQSALAFGPDSPDALEAVADAYESMGDHEKALFYLHAAVKKGASADIVSTDADLQALIDTSKRISIHK